MLKRVSVYIDHGALWGVSAKPYGVFGTPPGRSLLLTLHLSQLSLTCIPLNPLTVACKIGVMFGHLSQFYFRAHPCHKMDAIGWSVDSRAWHRKRRDSLS